MKYVNYQIEVPPCVEFGFSSSSGFEWVRIHRLRNFWEYQDFSKNDDSCYRGTFSVVNGIVHPHPGEVDLPEVVLIALNRLYKEVDYETEID